MATFTLLQPAPSWVTVSPGGLLTLNSPLVPVSGYSGSIMVRAVEGSAIATKIIQIAIQAKYNLIQDFIEISEYTIGGFSEAHISEIKVEAAIAYFIDGQDTSTFKDIYLGGFGSSANQVTVNGVGVVVMGAPVTVTL